jgi:hypothetical protein
MLHARLIRVCYISLNGTFSHTQFQRCIRYCCPKITVHEMGHVVLHPAYLTFNNSRICMKAAASYKLKKKTHTSVLCTVAILVSDMVRMEVNLHNLLCHYVYTKF